MGLYIAPEPECEDFYRLRQEIFGHPEDVGLLRKVLSLICSKLIGMVLEVLLSKCPILEQVIVHGSSKLVHLGVESSTLKYLSIKYSTKIKSIEICNAKNVVPFLCCSQKRRIRLLLTKVPKLVEVYVSLYSWDVDYLGFLFATLPCCLQRLVLEMCTIYTY